MKTFELADYDISVRAMNWLKQNDIYTEIEFYLLDLDGMSFPNQSLRRELKELQEEIIDKINRVTASLIAQDMLDNPENYGLI